MQSNPKVLGENNATIAQGLSAWKNCIGLGNQAYARGDIACARASYEAALYNICAEMATLTYVPHRSYNHADWNRERCDNHMAALVVTYHNLADLLIQDGAPERALEYLCEAQQRIYILLHHPHTEVADLAQRHLQVTYRALVEFARSHGGQEKVEQTLLFTRFVCACCVSKIIH